MCDRREFLKGLSGAALGIALSGREPVKLALTSIEVTNKRKRREVTVGGRRSLTVDVHSHVLVPEAWELIKDYKESEGFASQRTNDIENDIHNVDARLARMNAEGIDMQAVGINPFWYWAPRDLAQQIVQLQNEKIAELCAAHPDRFVGLGAVALQYPELAAQQLDQAVNRFGLRGCLIGASVQGVELSSPEFDPFWDKAEQLGALVFMHPQNTPPDPLSGIRARLGGNGWLTNVIGHPLETTIALSHLVQEGVLDRFPNLKLCAAHGGGYLPSYAGRNDQCLVAFPKDCKPLKKKPSEYLKQVYFDSLVFTGEGLRHLAATVGASQVLLGTDFPTRWNPNGVDHVLGTPELSDDDKRAILGRNAARLLRISSELL